MRLVLDASVGMPRRWRFLRQTVPVSVAVGVISHQHVALATDACNVDLRGNTSKHLGKIIRRGTRLGALTGVLSYDNIDCLAELSSALDAATSLEEAVVQFSGFLAPVVPSILKATRQLTGAAVPDFTFGILLAEHNEQGPRLLHVELICDGDKVTPLVNAIHPLDHRLAVGAVGAVTGIGLYLEPLVSLMEENGFAREAEPFIIRTPNTLDDHVAVATRLVNEEIAAVDKEVAPPWWPVGIPVVYGPVTAQGL